MSFNHVKLSELDFDLEAVTTETGRTYKTPSGKCYPSITTVLSAYNKQVTNGVRELVTKLPTKFQLRPLVVVPDCTML